jgi:hypothetical protein
VKFNSTTRSALAFRRDVRDMTAAGFEKVGEGGGRLWELNRGGRFMHRIVECKISVCGKAVWVRTEQVRP